MTDTMSADRQAPSVSSAKTPDRLRPVRIWLYVLAAMVILMIIVGGITRLTNSGLSITSWKPISGVIPPLSDQAWQAEFDAYKQIPQYHIQNSWMSLSDFKFIFWWEWSHRLLGRLIGLVFIVPFLVFLVQRRLDRKLAPALGLLFVAGGLQGLIGWWMVSSGLVLRTEVSQYRLAIHLGAAALLYAALIWVARSIAPKVKSPTVSRGWFWLMVGFTALVYLQIIAGAFVAGLRAGYGYNTWPLIDGAFIPGGLGVMTPWWRNLFENALTVQFDHRMIAYTIGIAAILLVWFGRKMPGFSGVHRWLPVIGGLVLLQIVFGITTLLLVVPLDVAVTHQITAFLVFGSSIAYLAGLRRDAVL